MSTSNFTVTVSYEITSSNESWRELMDEGISPPSVTGGDIILPQGGTRPSRAAVTGGIFTEGSEAAGYAEENSKKIISSVINEEIQDHITELLSGGSANDIEMFLTNIVKNEYIKIASEFKDNPDEIEATNQVIDSIYVNVSINGPTMDEIQNAAKEFAMGEIKKMLGGVAS